MKLSFDGQKNPSLREFVESLPQVPIDPHADLFRAYDKIQPTYAAKINVPFEVYTLEGLHEGKAGDYLAVGVHGEMYPIDAAVFESSYRVRE